MFLDNLMIFSVNRQSGAGLVPVVEHPELLHS